jgi:hypothetical protein
MQLLFKIKSYFIQSIFDMAFNTTCFQWGVMVFNIIATFRITIGTPRNVQSIQSDMNINLNFKNLFINLFAINIDF